MAQHSANYGNLNEQYNKGYISKQTLRGYVELYKALPSIGITAEEYKLITGEEY